MKVYSNKEGIIMNVEQLSLRVQELTQEYGIELDNTPDYFKMLQREKIASFLLSLKESSDTVDKYIEIGRKMAYIDALVNGEGISIYFTKKRAKGEDDALLPLDYLDKDIRPILAESIYNTIHRDLVMYVYDIESLSYNDRPFNGSFQWREIWRKAKDRVKEIISHCESYDKSLSQRQKIATRYLCGIVYENEANKKIPKTSALCFAYDTLLSCGLIESKSPLIREEKKDYLKNYLKETKKK